MEPVKKFMKAAISLSESGMRSNKGGPFGAVVVKDGKIIGRGNNHVTSTNDPTAHAEVVAIRKACKKLKNFELKGCDLYTSCEPCPMCFGAMYWTRVDRVYYANTQADAAAIGFDDAFIYEELARPIDQRKLPFVQLMQDKANVVFQEWNNKKDKIRY